MAYINTKEVKAIRENLKKEFPSWKFSVVGGGTSTVRINILKASLDFVADYKAEYQNIESGYPVYAKESENNFIASLKKGYCDINHHNLESSFKGATLKALTKILSIAKSQNWFDKSDVMTDYFFVSYYIDINLGKWHDKGVIHYEKIEDTKVTTKTATASSIDHLKLFEDAIIESFNHTKTNERLLLLKLDTKLSKENFKSFSIWLKLNKGGYYSRFKGGFILKDEVKQVA